MTMMYGSQYTMTIHGYDGEYNRNPTRTLAGIKRRYSRFVTLHPEVHDLYKTISHRFLRADGTTDSIFIVTTREMSSRCWIRNPNIP